MRLCGEGVGLRGRVVRWVRVVRGVGVGVLVQKKIHLSNALTTL